MGGAGDAMNQAGWGGDRGDIRQLQSHEREDLDIMQELEAREAGDDPQV